MANKSVLELAVGTGQWDAGLKKAKDALNNFTQAQGGLQSALKSDSDKMQQFVKMMGNMDSSAKTAKGQLNDYKGTIEQLTMQYNRMTDAQKQTIGQDYLRAIDQMKQKYQGVAEEVAKINQSLNTMPEPAAATGGGLSNGGKLDGMLQVFGGNLMTKGASMLAGFASEIGNCIEQGIELAKQGEGVRLAFERLNQPGLLDNLNEATHGTVSNLELMKAAVKFDDFKLPVEELGTMLAFAQKKAKDTGQSIDYMVDSIVTGLGRKSLMILDNLGLSAAEIKERMKETGDMTKAVGEIIREQMAKAGEYIETSADKAAQADKRLKDAMEDFGRTFQPLSDAGASLWNDLKVGALDLLNNAVRPLIDALTEAGRIRAQYASQGGDSRVNRQLGRLENIHSLQYRRNTYNAQLSNYDSKIGSYEQYLSDYKKWQSDKTSVGAYDRMQAFQKQTGLSMYSDVKEQLEVFKKMRAEYVMGAKSIIADNPAPSPTSPTATTKTTGGSGKSSTPTIDDFNKILAKSMNGSVDLKETKDLLSPYEMMLPEIKKNILDIKDADLGGSLAKLGDKKVTAEIAEINKQVEQQHKAFDLAAQSAANLGNALASIDDPGAKAAGTVLSAIANIALGFSQAAATASSLGPYGWIAYLAAGTAAMATTISTIHSLTGYANGGEIKGNSYSGDNLMAMGPDGGLIGLNAGEIVLNKAQSANLATSLQQGGGGATRIVGVLKGEDIVLMADRWGMRTGRGELLFGKNL